MVVPYVTFEELKKIREERERKFSDLQWTGLETAPLGLSRHDSEISLSRWENLIDRNGFVSVNDIADDVFFETYKFKYDTSKIGFTSKDFAKLTQSGAIIFLTNPICIA